MMSFITCCEYPADSFIHRSARECGAAMGEPKCMGADEHHAYERRLDLERGKWSYLVLSHHDVWFDATWSFTDALRAARRYLAMPVSSVRKGLAYGLILERSDGLTVTIVPTPRHQR